MTTADVRQDGAWRRWLGYLARVALTLIILFGLVSILGDDRLPDVVRRITLAAFLASLALNIVASIFLPAVVSFLSAKPSDLSLGLGRLVVINFTIRFYTLILPRAYATAIRWLKYRATGTGSDAAALVVLEKLVQVFTYAALALVFIMTEWGRLGGAAPALAGVAGLMVVVSGAGLAVIFTDKADPLLAKLSFVFRIRWVGGLISRLWSAVRSQRGRSPTQVLSLALWTALGYAFFVASAWVFAQSLGIDVSVGALSWIRGLVFLGTLLPITIAGAGIREAGFVGFLSVYDTDATTALGLALALLAVQIAIGAMGGLLELISVVTRRSRREPDESSLNSHPPEVARNG